MIIEFITRGEVIIVNAKKHFSVELTQLRDMDLCLKQNVEKNGALYNRNFKNNKQPSKNVSAL